MKSNLHPNWNHDANVTCACGNTFTTGSVNDSLHVDICSACHPFYTGEMKFVDTQGRVDKFMQKMQRAQTAKPSKKKSAAQIAADSADQKSYKQLLQEQQVTLKKQAAAV